MRNDGCLKRDDKHWKNQEFVKHLGGGIGRVRWLLRRLRWGSWRGRGETYDEGKRAAPPLEVRSESINQALDGISNGQRKCSSGGNCHETRQRLLQGPHQGQEWCTQELKDGCSWLQGRRSAEQGDTGGAGRAQIRQSLQAQGDKFRCSLRHDGNLLRLQSKQGIHN